MDAHRWYFPEFPIVFFTLRFPSTNDPQPFQPAKVGCHDRGAMFAVVAIVIYNHPVVRGASFVGMGGIGEQRRVVTVTTPAVQNREPGAPGGIEAARRNRLEPSGGTFPPVLLVHIEQLRDRRLPGTIVAWGWRTHAAQAVGERVPNAVHALHTQAGGHLETAIVSGHLEFLQGLDPKLVVQLRREDFADPRHRHQERDRVTLSSQTIEHRELAVLEDVTDRPGDADSNPREILKTFQSILLEDLGDRLLKRTQCLGSPPIRFGSKPIGALLNQNSCHLIEPAGDVIIERNWHLGVGIDCGIYFVQPIWPFHDATAPHGLSFLAQKLFLHSLGESTPNDRPQSFLLVGQPVAR